MVSMKKFGFQTVCVYCPTLKFQLCKMASQLNMTHYILYSNNIPYDTHMDQKKLNNTSLRIGISENGC